MADPVTDQVTVGIVLFVIALVLAAFFETRFLRKKMKNRRVRTAKRETELPDEAHNAIITTKAIISSLERQGIRSEEASAWVREAEMAYGRHNYRVVVELTGKARDRLLALKAADGSKGDLVKLEQLSVAGGSEEITTKEVLQKEVTPNLLQSKFSIEVAGTAIDQGRLAGRDVSQATELLESAKARFDAKEYDAALSIARQSKRSAEGKAVDVSIPPPPVRATPVSPEGRTCPSCNATLQSDDAFCRKCGTRLVPTSCGSCGAKLLPDDVFCRKCGAAIAR